ncbi:putative alpha/beta hydrolase [Lentinula aciculospora]|uniref:Alpha/beta hydrolase n=1 Tax=Lentinula aciculospora TaxID=153920 RepID=A0A9W9AF22_9AGAR|nr:putative alpha/beta hydrolase [Lentinula aciculospora]
MPALSQLKISATTTTNVLHLGGIMVGYKLARDRYDSTKPTSVLANSMCTTVSLFSEMFANNKLIDTMNLLAIEPLGHGTTRCPTEHFTYWDSIKEAFAFGASQGGWTVVRVALIAPDRILMPTGTSMDYESADSRSKGACDSKLRLNPFYQKWSSLAPTPNFILDDVWCEMVVDLGFPKTVSTAQINFWNSTMKKKVRGALLCLLERDGLSLRLRNIKCPVNWLQGNQDMPFGAVLATEQIRLFTSSEEAKLQVIKGGSHYLNASNPIEIGDALLADGQKNVKVESSAKDQYT